MILWILAIGGLLFVIASVRWRRTISRFLLGALGVTLGFFLWLALGRHNLYVAWAPFILLPVGVFAWWKARKIRSHRREVERAFKDEVGDDGKPSIPRVTGWERFDA